MSGVDYARFCSAIDTLVHSVGIALTKYNKEVAQCLNGGESDQLVRWINENRPQLRPLVTGIPNVQKWASDARLVINQANHVVGNGSAPSNSSALSSCDSDLNSNSGESMAILDKMIGDIDEDLGEPLFDVFDDQPDGPQVPIRLPATQQQPSREDRSVNGSADWERSYHLLQNALLKYRGIDGLYAAGQNKQLKGKEQASIQEALEWSGLQREMRRQNKLTQDQIKLLDSLCTRKLWSWENADKAPSSRPPSAQPAHSGQRNSAATPPPNGDADARPLRDLDNRAPFPAAPPSATVQTARRNANKAILRKVSAQINRVKKREASHKKQDDEWLKYFGLLMEYDVMHGTFQVPEDTVVRDNKGDAYALGVWLSAQLAGLKEYEFDYPLYFAALMDLFATGRLWVREDSRAGSPEQANGTSGSSAPAQQSTSSQANPGSRAASPATARTALIGGAGPAVAQQHYDATHGHGREGRREAEESDSSPGGTACSSPERSVSPSHDHDSSAPGLARAGDDPGLELLLAAARKAASAFDPETGLRSVGDGAGGGTAPSTPPGTKRKASPLPPPPAHGSGTNTVVTDGHRSKKVVTSTAAPGASTATNLVTSQNRPDSLPPSTTILSAPAAVSLRDKHLFQSRTDSAFQEVGVSLPMPTLARSASNNTSATGTNKSVPSHGATQRASPAVSATGNQYTTAPAPIIPTPKRTKSPLSHLSTALTASNGSSTGTSHRRDAAPTATIQPPTSTAVHPAAPAGASRADENASYRLPSVRRLDDEFVAFVYDGPQHRPVFGIGRVLSETTDSQGETRVQVRQLTSRESSDPVRTRYTENARTDPVLTLKAALVRGLRMDEDRNAVFPLKLAATSRALLQPSYDAIKAVLT